MFARIVLLVVVLCGALLVRAEEPEVKPGDKMIEQYLKGETERLSKRFLDGAKTLGEWEARKPRLRQEYLDMLGLWPLPEKSRLEDVNSHSIRSGASV